MGMLSDLLSRSIIKKFIMGLSGLFLVSFLVVHLIGNFQLFNDDGGVAFNTYTKFMSTNPVIGLFEKVLFAGFIIHIVMAIILTLKNNAARPVKYAGKSKSAGSSWFSRNMGISGSIIFIFLATHLYMFYGVYHYDETGHDKMITIEQAHDGVYKVLDEGVAGVEHHYVDHDAYMALSTEQRNQKVKAWSMYKLAEDGFKQWWITLLYVLAMVLLGFHLNHGFQSSFRSVGFEHKKYTPFLKKLGVVFSIVVPLLFAAMPIFLFLK